MPTLISKYRFKEEHHQLPRSKMYCPDESNSNSERINVRKNYRKHQTMHVYNSNK